MLIPEEILVVLEQNLDIEGLEHLLHLICSGLYLLEAVQTSSKFGKPLDPKVTYKGYRLLIVQKEGSQPGFFLLSDRKVLFIYMLLCWSKLLGEEIDHSFLVLYHTNIMFKFSVYHIVCIFFQYFFLNPFLATFCPSKA